MGDINVDGILSVKASEQQTWAEQSVTIQGASTLDEKEVEKMLEEAEKFAEADKANRKNIDLVNKAENVCYEADKQIELFKETISEDEKTSIENLSSTIR